ncbi:hypothetical protein IWQ56_001850 [Coemansia nantahalensis]|nr:hypothetical protein IWQ56_001850 [Coemansia nantahalensis]
MANYRIRVSIRVARPNVRIYAHCACRPTTRTSTPAAAAESATSTEPVAVPLPAAVEPTAALDEPVAADDPVAADEPAAVGETAGVVETATPEPEAEPTVPLSVVKELERRLHAAEAAREAAERDTAVGARYIAELEAFVERLYRRLDATADKPVAPVEEPAADEEPVALDEPVADENATAIKVPAAANLADAHHNPAAAFSGAFDDAMAESSDASGDLADELTGADTSWPDAAGSGPDDDDDAAAGPSSQRRGSASTLVASDDHTSLRRHGDVCKPAPDKGKGRTVDEDLLEHISFEDAVAAARLQKPEVLLERRRSCDEELSQIEAKISEHLERLNDKWDLSNRQEYLWHCALFDKLDELRLRSTVVSHEQLVYDSALGTFGPEPCL